MPGLSLPLETPRLRLRDFEATDFDAVRRYALDPRVLEQVLHEPRTEQELATHFGALLKARLLRPRRSYELAVVVRRTGTLVGTCELTRLPGGGAEIGYLLAHRHWGRGYASEAAMALRDAAFAQWRVTRLRALVATDNDASRRVLEKCGLHWTALRRRHAHAKGRWWDCDEYELLESDWARARANAAPAARPGAAR